MYWLILWKTKKIALEFSFRRLGTEMRVVYRGVIEDDMCVSKLQTVYGCVSGTRIGIRFVAHRIFFFTQSRTNGLSANNLFIITSCLHVISGRNFRFSTLSFTYPSLFGRFMLFQLFSRVLIILLFSIIFDYLRSRD